MIPPWPVNGTRQYKASLIHESAAPGAFAPTADIAVKVALLNSLHGFGKLITVAQPTNSEVTPMRKHPAALATAAALGLFLLPAPGANAMTVGTASGIQQSLAKTSVVEQVVRICHRNMRTGRRVCWIDRSQPPTVCHLIRERDGSRRLDCY